MKEQIMAVQRMQDYIDKHLDEEITMADLARTSLFSPWHSYRLFTSLTKQTPSKYIRRLRLSKSAMKLKNKDSKIIDIAFSLGFGSVDGYQRAFLQEFGCNPSEYSHNPIPINLFIPYGVKFKEIRKENTIMENVSNVFIQVLKKPERKVLIKRGVKAEDYFAYCEEVGCDIWGLLMSMDSVSGEPVCLWLPNEYKLPNTSTYVQGVEVDINYSGTIPEGFDTITLPACEYLMFQGEPFKEEDYCEAICAVQNAIKKYNPEPIGYKYDSSIPRVQLEPQGDRGYIELLGIRKL